MITFKTDAYGDIMYFNDVAKHLLVLMGHSGTVPGALKADEVSAALAHLKQKLGKTDNKSLAVEKEEMQPEISLVNRAYPLISLLEAAEKKHCDVLWFD